MRFSSIGEFLCNRSAKEQCTSERGRKERERNPVFLPANLTSNVLPLKFSPAEKCCVSETADRCAKFEHKQMRMQSGLSNIRLKEQQLHMLRLFKDPMPEEDFSQMKRLAVQLLAKKLDILMEDWESKNGITEKYYDELSRQHFRSSGKSTE